MPRVLVVNADDFGLSPGVNRGIVRAHEEGIVTSASLMVRQPAAEDAAAYGRGHPRLGLGLHVDLGEWAFESGEWTPRYEVVALDDPSAVASETVQQLSRFRDLVGREPTHLDSHQHVHRNEPVRSALAEIAGGLAIPVRHFTPGIRYCGDFYGRMDDGTPIPAGVGPDHLIRILRSLPEGVTELACHPSAAADMESSYGADRLVELEALCDPAVREALSEEEIRLCSFSTLSAPSDGPAVR